jgi:Ca2+-binding EF-hand superfamily protein
VDGIKALVKNKFGGDYRAAFDAYAGPDGKIDSDELSTVLEQAGIGNGLTRGFWVSGVLDKVDQDGDRKISWPEFQAVVG